MKELFLKLCVMEIDYLKDLGLNDYASEAEEKILYMNEKQLEDYYMEMHRDVHNFLKTRLLSQCSA